MPKSAALADSEFLAGLSEGMAKGSQAGWQSRGACRESNPEFFAYVAGTSEQEQAERKSAVAQGKAVCRDCPVRMDCLVHALGAGEKFNLWGGFTESERLRIAEQLNLAEAAAAN